jgi:signal transduction histidine kinase
MINYIKSSFIRRIFVSLIFIFLFLFISFFAIQSLYFKTFYTERIIDQTTKEISIFSDNVDTLDSDDLLLELSNDTHTLSAFLSEQQLSDNLEQLDSLLIKVEDINKDVYDIIISSNYSSKVGESDNITASIVPLRGYNSFYTISLIVNNEILLNSEDINNQVMPNRFLNDEILTNSAIEITGKIIETQLIYNEDSSYISPIISNEIINLSTSNFFDSGYSNEVFYYYSKDENGDFSHIVFINTTETQMENYILISTYSLSQVDEVIASIRSFNLYTIIIVSSVLLLASIYYSKSFSKPLTLINNYTKKLAELDFDEDLKVKSNDEFRELSENINFLKQNLKTTLEKLNDQNRILMTQIENENTKEIERQQFVRGMSHELKTPLAVIQAAAEAIEKGIYTNKLEVEQTLRKIQEEVIRTNKILIDMVQVYNLDSSILDNEKVLCRLDEIIKEQLQNVSIIAEKKKLSIDLDVENIKYFCIMDKMKLVISNLISNAIKYSPENTKIHIKLSTKNGMIEFSIRNQAEKVSNEDLPKLFDAFYRTDKSRNRTDGSTGLGLYIVQSALNQHDSGCKVKIEDNQIIFSFELKILNLDD